VEAVLRVARGLKRSAALSLTGGSLRLEKGTTFRLTVNESASVGNKR
jgi:hypothetical protein